MSTNKLPNQNSSVVQSYNKSNLSETERLQSSIQMSSKDINNKKENSSSELNDYNNINTNNFSNSNIAKTEQSHIVIKSQLKSKSKSSFKINTSSHSNFTKNKSHEHIVINSKPKKPDLIRNVHYRKNIKKSNDNFRYQPISSFEQKLSKQLSRVSNKYNVVKNRKFFNNDLKDTELFWSHFPEYEIYRQLKELETRKELPNAFTKPRLKPLICQRKDKLGVLAKNLYEADQIERFKKFLVKQYKIKIKQEKKE